MGMLVDSNGFDNQGGLSQADAFAEGSPSPRGEGAGGRGPFLSASATVVIPNWNGRHLLPTCLGALAAQTAQGFRTIVVDNGSADDSLAYLRDTWPAVELIALPRNLGFAGGVNVGLRAATGEYVALLNTDTEAEPGWLAALLAAADQYPQAASFTPRMLRFHDRGTIDEAGNAYSRWGFGYQIGDGAPDGPAWDAPREVFGASGGGGLYRRAALVEVGLFDAAYFAYGEDVDLAWRLRLAGYPCRYVPAARLYHMRGGTSGRKFPQRHITRNNLLTLAKDWPAPLLRTEAPRLLLQQGFVLLGAARHGRLADVLAGYRESVQQLPHALRQRRAIQARRRASIRELRAAMSPGRGWPEPPSPRGRGPG